MAKKSNRYTLIIVDIFEKHFISGEDGFVFEREELEHSAAKLAIKLPKNLGDVIYSFRYRAALPDSIAKTAPEGKEWVIRPAGMGLYRFSLTKQSRIVPNPALARIKIPDATPGIIERHAFSDEQALLAKVRYNRLIDIFSGITCYSLQNHLRTTASELGQVEVDELYVGVDKHGAQYVFPVQAKAGRDQINVVQIEQDLAVCAEHFPHLVCRPIAVQFLKDRVIAIFECMLQDNAVVVVTERHYELVRSSDISNEELLTYRAQRG